MSLLRLYAHLHGNPYPTEDGRVLENGSHMLSSAREIAMKENCYKIMLMTSAKEKSTLRFYERAGYNAHDKTAFVHWL